MHNNKSEDRGMMKWAPFYSVMSESEIKKTYQNKEKYEKPELSDEQIEQLENLIVEAYNNKYNIELTIIDKNQQIKLNGIITKLEPIHKAIYLNKKMILFNNIINIKFM